MLAELKQGYSARPGTLEDVEALVDLYNEYWKAMIGIVKFSVDDFRGIFSTPGFDMAASLRVVLSPAGEIVGSALVMDLANPPIHPGMFGCVRQGFESQGIGSHLLDWGEARARHAIERCPEGARVSMQVQTTPTHQPTLRLFQKKGLTPVRYSWIMLTELNGTPPEPIWPEGIRIETYQNFTDLEAIVRAVDEAFADHWGYVDRSGDPERMKRVQHSLETDPDFDPTLWYLAFARDEIAAVALCGPKMGEDRQTGFVQTLGVRRPWRRQGLGLALLHLAFGEFHRRGYAAVGLGVDTQNLSGATRLYEKAGMRAISELAVYEKELRAGEELSKQSN
jgi:GNAT superfamily N-acetyltransferase